MFIDARNVFTQVDRAHRKFSDEQIKNLGIITRLYEGDREAFADLINEYKECGKDKDKKEYFDEQITWLNERFPNGEYQDVIGLCKVVKLGEIYDKDGNIKEVAEDSIADQDYSLNAGRYVGVVIEDDGMTEEEFKKKMISLNDEFNELSKEANKLEKSINANIKELFK